nr:MAG TPA: hypothetical protein [Caudoviricetes sp.]
MIPHPQSLDILDIMIYNSNCNKNKSPRQEGI